MKVWPIDPLVPRNLRLEVPEKLPQGSTELQRTKKTVKARLKRIKMSQSTQENTPHKKPFSQLGSSFLDESGSSFRPESTTDDSQDPVPRDKVKNELVVSILT